MIRTYFWFFRKQGNKLRRLMTFAWPCLLSKNCVDPATKYHGHLLLSHIIAKFAIHKRIVLQVTGDHPLMSYLVCYYIFIGLKLNRQNFCLIKSLSGNLKEILGSYLIFNVHVNACIYMDKEQQFFS